MNRTLLSNLNKLDKLPFLWERQKTSDLRFYVKKLEMCGYKRDPNVIILLWLASFAQFIIHLFTHTFIYLFTHSTNIYWKIAIRCSKATKIKKMHPLPLRDSTAQQERPYESKQFHWRSKCGIRGLAQNAVGAQSRKCLTNPVGETQECLLMKWAKIRSSSGRIGGEGREAEEGICEVQRWDSSGELNSLA